MLGGYTEDLAKTTEMPNLGGEHLQCKCQPMLSQKCRILEGGYLQCIYHISYSPCYRMSSLYNTLQSSTQALKLSVEAKHVSLHVDYQGLPQHHFLTGKRLTVLKFSEGKQKASPERKSSL